MNTLFKLVITGAFLLSMPLAALAMDHDHSMHDSGKMGSMDHGAMKQGDMDHGKMSHDSMNMGGDMIMLGGAQAQMGVTANAHLKDVKDAMAKMGMKETHHFMVMFKDDKSGQAMDTGSVAVKIVDPAGKESDPIMLMGMQGHFGADISLADKGDYTFKVGSKLADGTKRQFEFKYTLK